MRARVSLIDIQLSTVVTLLAIIKVLDNDIGVIIRYFDYKSQLGRNFLVSVTATN